MILFVLHTHPVPIQATSKPRLKPNAKALVEEFVAIHVHPAPGHLIPFSEFRERFDKWLSQCDVEAPSNYAINRALPERHASGVGNQNKTYLINCAWTPQPPDTPYYIVGGRIKRKT